MAVQTPIPWSSGLRVLAARFGEAVAVSGSSSGPLSYRQLCSRAHALAVRVEQAGGSNGVPIATLLPNGPTAVCAAYGVRMTGAAETPLGYGLTSDEIAWMAGVAGFRTVITPGERVEEVRALGLEPLLLEDAPALDPGRTFPPVPGDARGRILFTSGTTGRPKGVVYSHARRWAGEQLQKAALPFTPSRGDRILLMTPFSHGASLLAFAWCDLGGEVLLLPSVDIDRIREPLRAGDLDAVFAPPTVLAKLADAFRDEHFPDVRCVFTGTAPLTAVLYRKARALFGPVIRITYGKTECINPITVLDAVECESLFSSGSQEAGSCVGWPAPGVELRVEAGDDTEECAAQEGATDGEVWLRASQMSNGLIGPDGFGPHQPDGWHRTGDRGRIDSKGRLWLTGRVADVIKTGGYRVNPDEIESLLAGLPGCGPVCVTSLPSDYWGEVIIAVAEDAASGWEVEGQDRVGILSRHKRPRAWVAIEALPRNAQGKTSRRQVREAVLAMHDLIDGPYPSLSKRAGAGPG